MSNIEDNLDALGLGHIPVIVLSARRALDARAPDPYLGPDAEGRARRLERSGRAGLLAASNLPVLEALFTALVSTAAVDLRLASLRDGARSIHRNAKLELREAGAESLAAVTMVEGAIASSLRVLGYPSSERRRSALRDDRVRDDLLTRLEDLRGEPFDAPASGGLESYVRTLLNAHLKALELASLVQAEELVREAYERGPSISESEFDRRVYDNRAISRQAQQVWSDGIGYARQRLNLAAEDTDADASFSARAFSTGGGAGRGWRRAALGLRGGGILAGIGLVVALMNSWNPIGWVAAGAILGWLGKRTARKAEQKRLKARNRSLAGARKAVHGTYRDLRKSIRADILASVWESAGPSVRALLASAIGHRQLREEIAGLALSCVARAEAVPPRPAVAEVMRESVAMVLAGSGTPNAAGTLWGERWVDGSTEDLRQPGERRAAQGEGSLVPALHRLVPYLTPEAARRWAASVSDSEFPGLAAIGQQFSMPDAVPVAVLGDYNSGKSSLVKRLLIEAGRPVPPDLMVGARPTTDEARSHDLGDVVLIDTPGMQSGVPAHEARALDVLGEAAVILLTFHPNLVLGDTRLLSALAEGTAKSPARGAHILALVNRADELGVDPTTSPKEFDRLRTRKRIELTRALARHGIEVDRDQVRCIAADPFGLGGDRQDVQADEFAANASWDGIDGLRDGLLELGGPLGDRARSTAAVVTRLSELLDRTDELGVLVAQSEARSAELLRIETILDRAEAQAAQLRADLAATAEEAIAAHARGPYDELLQAQSEKDIAATLRQFEHWYEGELFVSEIEEWALGAEEQINAWAKETSSSLLREFNRHEMRAAFGGMPKADLGGLVSDDTGALGMRLAHRGLIELVATFSNRDAVYRVGKALGYRFRPWEAVGKARAIGKLGPYLAGLGVVLDGLDLANDLRREHRREEARRSADGFLTDSVTAVTDYLVTSDEIGGPIQHLAELVAALRDMAITMRQERQALDLSATAARSEAEQAAEFIASGRALLDQREGDEPHDPMG